MNLRLTYNVTRPFSLARTIVGISAIVGLLSGIAAITYLVKGHVPYPITVLLPQSEIGKGLQCNQTIIYPGQTFGSKDINSTYTYTALTHFPYLGQPLENCVLPSNTTWFEVLPYPPAWPTINWGVVVQCDLPEHPQSVQLGVSSLNHDCRNPNVQEEDSLEVEIWSQIHTVLDGLKDERCVNESITGFRVDFRSVDPVWLLPTSSYAVCVSGLDNSSSSLGSTVTQDVQKLVGLVETGVAYDFGKAFDSSSAFDQANAASYVSMNGSGMLAVLPGGLYPCVSYEQVPAKWSAILFEIYTSVSASWSILLFLITLLLIHTSTLDDELPSHGSRGIDRISTRSSSGSESYPLLNPNPLTPTTPYMIKRGLRTPEVSLAFDHIS